MSRAARRWARQHVHEYGWQAGGEATDVNRQLVHLEAAEVRRQAWWARRRADGYDAQDVADAEDQMFVIQREKRRLRALRRSS